MYVDVSETPEVMGEHAAVATKELICDAIAAKGCARIALSTGASQFEFLSSLVKQEVEWDKVEMFHLDEYIGLPESHVASFRKYLKKRFVDLLPLKAAHFVSGEGDVGENIRLLTEEIRRAPIDIAAIGIGENSHIAFNDPPANFDTEEAYIVVTLNERCKRQQMNEGWFASIDAVPQQAVSMTIFQMMSAEHIISCVPGERKAEAIKMTFEAEGTTNLVPATKLFEHSDWRLYLDRGSASLTSEELFIRGKQR